MSKEMSEIIYSYDLDISFFVWNIFSFGFVIVYPVAPFVVGIA